MCSTPIRIVSWQIPKHRTDHRLQHPEHFPRPPHQAWQHLVHRHLRHPPPLRSRAPMPTSPVTPSRRRGQYFGLPEGAQSFKRTKIDTNMLPLAREKSSPSNGPQPSRNTTDIKKNKCPVTAHTERTGKGGIDRSPSKASGNNTGSRAPPPTANAHSANIGGAGSSSAAPAPTPRQDGSKAAPFTID